MSEFLAMIEPSRGISSAYFTSPSINTSLAMTPVVEITFPFLPFTRESGW